MPLHKYQREGSGILALLISTSLMPAEEEGSKDRQVIPAHQEVTNACWRESRSPLQA